MKWAFVSFVVFYFSVFLRVAGLVILLDFRFACSLLRFLFVCLIDVPFFLVPEKSARERDAERKPDAFRDRLTIHLSSFPRVRADLHLPEDPSSLVQHLY